MLKKHLFFNSVRPFLKKTLNLKDFFIVFFFLVTTLLNFLEQNVDQFSITVIKMLLTVKNSEFVNNFLLRINNCFSVENLKKLDEKSYTNMYEHMIRKGFQKTQFLVD